MYQNRHRSWLVTILQIRSPLIIWGTCITVLSFVASTYLFEPIYSAKTVITLDAELASILRNINISYPSITKEDYIRHEFFATHHIALIRNPSLANNLIIKWEIKNHKNERIAPEYFVEPSFSKLIFNNLGNGIRVKWISDTQQFSINGYSKDPDQAVLYSNDYTKEFLKENANQFHDTLKSLTERFDSQQKYLRIKLDTLGSDIFKIYSENKAADIETEIEILTNQILTAESDLKQSRFMEKNHMIRIVYLKNELEKFKKLDDFQKIMEVNPQIQNIKIEIQELTSSLILASVDYAPEHPEYIAIKKRLDNAKNVLKNEAKVTFYRTIKQRTTVLDTILESILDENLTHLIHESEVESYISNINNYNARLNILLSVSKNISSLQREEETLLTLLSENMEHQNSLKNIMAKSLPFYRVVSPATINANLLKQYKFFPKRKKILALSFIGALLSFSFFVIAKELYANTIFRGWQLSYLDKPVQFSEVPYLMKAEINDRHMFNFFHHIKEMHLATIDSQVIRIISFQTDEGKAALARSLSLYYKNIGKSALLFDTDFKNKSLTRSLNLHDRPGLYEYVCKRKPLNEVIVRDHAYGVQLIPIGNQEFTEDDLPNLKILKNSFSKLTLEFEKIIFVDSPLNDNLYMIEDILPSHDIIMTINSGNHSLFDIERILNLYGSANNKVKLRGMTINKIPFEVDLFSYKGIFRMIEYIMRYPFKPFRK